MDRRWMDRDSRHGSDDSEPEYDVVEDREVQSLHVPVRPMNHNSDYADRDPPRPRLAPGPSAATTSNVNIPPRKTQMATGPAVNRDLKPGRRANTFGGRARKTSHTAATLPGKSTVSPANNRLSTPVQLGYQHSRRHSPSPVRDQPGVSVRKPPRKDQRASKREEFSQHPEGLWSAERFLDPGENQRHRLELESSDRQERPTQRAARHLQHKQPQSKEDHQDVAPREEPRQPCCQEEWYVRGCSRLDAEHALHLANTDGAFLVRDSSMNTSDEPLVLAMYYEKKVYNIKIRFLEDTNKYALGTGLRSNDMFDSVADMVRFHSIFPIVMVSGRNIPGSRFPESCVLTCPVTRRDVDLLLQ